MVGDGRSAKGIQAHYVENKTDGIWRKLRSTEDLPEWKMNLKVGVSMYMNRHLPTLEYTPRNLI